jgi:tripartite-type tricarboxylate transporter receptor subunit TctC
MTNIHSVQTTFNLVFTDEQYEHAREYVEDMKKHPKRVFWLGKEGKSDEELILSQIAHRILSGFYNNYDPSFARTQIKSMQNAEL